MKFNNCKVAIFPLVIKYMHEIIN